MSTFLQMANADRSLGTLITGFKVANLEERADVTVSDGEVHINGARILARDRQGSNGVIHSIITVYPS